ncbi:MAG: peptidase M4 family protein [Acidobacteria bacterium]|nr:peptidase M4 family protein [Acidobacteriota bacterium]
MNVPRWWLAAIVVALAAASGRHPAAQAGVGAITIAPASIAELRAADALVDALVRDEGLRLVKERGDTLIQGRRHERFRQYYKGVPVFGAGVARQLDAAQTISIFGKIYAGIDMDPAPRLSREEGQAAIVEAAGAPLGVSHLPELVILPTDTGSYVLAYKATVFARGDLTTYFADARSGGIVLRFSELKRQTAVVGRGKGVLNDDKKLSVSSLGGTFVAMDRLRPPDLRTYDLRGNLSRTESFLNGVIALGTSDLATDSDNNWTDVANVDGHVHAGYVYDYYFKRFGRRGIDDLNAPVVSLIHPVRRQDIFSADPDVIGTFYLNAFWCGGCGPDGKGVMVYGEGLPPGVLLTTGQYVDYFSGGLDVVGHELTHGVTEHSSNLVYRGESGALNEAFSDMIGASVEFFFQPTGAGPLKADYLLGEDIITPGGIRSMADPASHGDPDHFSKRYTGTEDNGGVHINSGIPNHAFYLAIEGGVNRTSGLAVRGVGAPNRDQIEKVFYRAFVFLLQEGATFSMARAATIESARDLYGSGSAAERAVTEAWTAVGVN